jgi:hypothetical protein
VSAELIEVTLKLDPITLVMLAALATHLRMPRDEVVTVALKVLFSSVPRPDD